MKNYFEVSVTPTEEDCIQAGGNGHFQNLEVTAMIKQLDRTFGKWPYGFTLEDCQNLHQAGKYRTFKLYYREPEDGQPTTPSMRFALKLESEWPAKWDDQSIEFLKENNYSTLTISRRNRNNSFNFLQPAI